jgi:putative chitinase
MPAELQDDNANASAPQDDSIGGAQPARSVDPAPEPVARPDPAPAPAAEAAPAPVVRPGVLLTAETFKRFAPRAKPELLAIIGDKGNEVLARFGINTTANRLCHFLAQVSHECAGFTAVEENLNYSAANMVRVFGPRHSARLTDAEARKLVGKKEAFAERVYGLGNPTMARMLGNTQAGDGFRYRGRGFMQITGRANYRTMGRKIGVDLEADPDLAAQPLYALMTAAAFWDTKGLNQYADQNNIEIITKRINGGHSGLDHRKSGYASAQKIWGQGAASAGRSFSTRSFGGPPVLEYGDLRPEVLDLKKLLQRAGYQDLQQDENFGASTHLAVVRYQLAHNLQADGVVDAATWDALGLQPEGPRTRGVSAMPEDGEARARERGRTIRRWGFLLLLAAVGMAAARYLLAGGIEPPTSLWDGFTLGFVALVAIAAIVLIVLASSMAHAKPQSDASASSEFDEWGIRPEVNAEAA